MSRCADPVLCYTSPSGKQSHRHWSLASYVFRISAQQVFNCGKCVFCRKRSALETASKVCLDASVYKENSFLTLTYDESKEGYHNDFDREDIRKFNNRLRRHCAYHFGKKIKIFYVHEYGKNGKKHWHLLVLNHEFDDKVKHGSKNGIPYFTSKKLQRLWPHGFVSIGDVSEASAMYQSQYMEKDLKNGNYNNCKKSQSYKRGLGREFFYENYEQLLRLGYVPVGSKKLPLPRYFQRLADRHYSFFYDQSAFSVLPGRKNPKHPKFDFRTDWPTKEIADLYLIYLKSKQKHIDTLSQEWDEFVSTLTHDSVPDFIKSHNNTLHDLKQKQGNERF